MPEEGSLLKCLNVVQAAGLYLGMACFTQKCKWGGGAGRGGGKGGGREEKGGRRGGRGRGGRGGGRPMDLRMCNFYSFICLLACLLRGVGSS